jgi:OOP family OmpA-OmpF porin
MPFALPSVALLVALAPPAGVGGGAAVEASPVGADAQASAEGSPRPRLSRRKQLPWIRRWAPERNTVELGVYGGIFVPARDLELFEPDPLQARQGFKPLAKVAPDFGVRAAYLPSRFFGLELEGGVMPTKAEGDRATLWTARGHLIAQLGLWSVTPFAVVGASALGVQSSRTVVGDDVDAAIHVGLGTKFYLSRRAMIRIDLRDTISASRGVDQGATNTIEALVGVSIVLGRKRDRDEPTRPDPVPEPPPSDRDGDGVPDDPDGCPDVPGDPPTGCPPPSDRDGDTFIDEKDVCPDAPGIAPDGCPDRDPDKDNILDPDDVCRDQPETVNGFEDGDGCPDEIPSDFTDLEVLEGVFFATNEDKLGASSTEVLDRAAATLQKFPNVKVEISGHTDSTGNREHNMDLSQRRAEAVKRYLVGKGIDDKRLVTRGAGPDEPLDSNASLSGRAKNRRIEFRVLR